LDQTDFEIVKILCKDARTPFKKIAKALGIGTDTVFRRFKRLQQEGVILGSTVVLSSQACGIKGLCGLFVKLRSGSSVSIIKNKITQLSDLVVVYPEWGEYDFYIDAYFRDHQEIFDLISKMRKIKEIMTIDPMMYTQQDWSIPFASTFEAEPAPWILNIQE
jgi:Lrp/AsnC family transcriptional regulator for asnA, asnC and gidA